MITPEENTTYLHYANILFDYFKGCKAGQGVFLMRTMKATYSKYEQRWMLDYLYKILYNLCVNGYLEVKDVTSQFPFDEWISLTEKGYDYLHGGPLTVNKVDFSQFIDSKDSDNKQFDNLWPLIGEKDKAPFYLKGPTFLNMIRPYLDEGVSDYMTYMEERKQKELSTSRRVWYKELYTKVPKQKRMDFLSDLSYAVSLSYYFGEDSEDDYKEYDRELLTSVEEEVSSEIQDFPDLNINYDNERQSPEELLDITLKICNAFKSLVENNRLYRLLYNDDGTAKNEKAAQMLFFCIAQGYCDKYDIDLNRESDTGIGSLDFKLSVGHSSKVIIEMKLSTNTSLLHGFEKQLPAYLRAEETQYGIYLILQMNKESESQLNKVQKEYIEMCKCGTFPIKLICVDATKKLSASKI